jgi:hypothetical protein
MWFAGYDTNGNLFADGCTAQPPSGCTPGAGIEVVELPESAEKFVTLHLHGRGLAQIQIPGQIQWDGKGHLDVGGGQALVYWATEIPGGLKQFGATNFAASVETRQWFVFGNNFVVPNLLGNGFGPGSCATPTAPSVTCTQIYPNRLGSVSPRLEIDQPDYQLEPFGAVVSR